MICTYCYYYSDAREECDFNFDTEINENSYCPPCCREDDDYINSAYDYIGGIENE